MSRLKARKNVPWVNSRLAFVNYSASRASKEATPPWTLRRTVIKEGAARQVKLLTAVDLVASWVFATAQSCKSHVLTMC